MKKITRQDADVIIAENIHQKHRVHLVACFKGQWFDIRGMSKTEIVTGIKNIYGFTINPDAII